MKKNEKKLGRPPLSVVRQDKYIKVYMTQDEYDFYHAIFENVKKFHETNFGLGFGLPDFFRFLFAKADHPEILKIYFNEIKKDFKGGFFGEFRK